MSEPIGSTNVIYIRIFLNVLVMGYLTKLNKDRDLVYSHIFSMFFYENFHSIIL